MTLGRPGDLLADRYRLDRFVGGVGSVERWRAYDERLARSVTARLEPAPDDAAEQDESTAAAQAALTSMAQLNHPGVAAVYDVGTADGLRDGAVGYAISEWTEGRTLGQIMAGGPQPWPRTADWGRQISGALAALHGIGIAHGALSPESVAIHDDRQVKILDAGLDSTRMPEHAGEELPPAASDDVYALGFLLWEATVGAAPEYVIPGANADAAAGTGATAGHGKTAARKADDTATQDIAVPHSAARGSATRDGATRGTAAQAAAATEPLATGTAPTSAGIDRQPLLDMGAPAELAVLLSQMLSADPSLRPTAAEAEQRFVPFAATERISDTLPGVAAVAAPTQVLGPPIAGPGAAIAAGSVRTNRDRRRGTMLGVVFLVAAVLAGLGFLLANLSSHSTGPNGVNTTIPSSSPQMVTLPNGSLSPAPTSTTTGGGQTSGSTPSTQASSSPTGQASKSAPASPSASASSSARPSTSASAGGGNGGATSSSAPVGGGATPSATSGHVLPHASS